MLIVAPLDGVSVEIRSIGLSLIETFCDKFSDQQLTICRNFRRGPAPGQTYPIAVIPTVPAEHPPFIGNTRLLTGRRS